MEPVMDPTTEPTTPEPVLEEEPTSKPATEPAILEPTTSTTTATTAGGTATAADIPTIDFGPFLKLEGIVVGATPTDGQRQVAKAIDEACRSHGFIHLVNFGLDENLREECFQASASLFAMDKTHKETQLYRITPETNRGYAPYRSEQLNRERSQLELKEAFNVRFPPAHQNDYRGCPKNFDLTSEKLQIIMKRAAQRYALACGLALDLPVEEYTMFADTLNKFDLCTIRFLHGPLCADEFADGRISQGDVEKPIRVGEHTDFGMVTFLLLGKHGAEGLQIKSVEGGEVHDTHDDGWTDVVVPPTGAIINTGALISRWTNDEWKATAHRVIVPNKVVAGRDRYSIAFFVDPDKHSLVQVHDHFARDGKTKKYEPITSEDYLSMKLKEMMG